LVAEVFRGIGNPVIGYDLNPDKHWAKSVGVEIKSFNEVLNKADILTLHIPVSSDKSPIISEKEINLMKNGSFLINISRGGVVDEDVLYGALKDKKLAGAAVDVFSKEPYDGPLCELDNIRLPPHLVSRVKI
jgi:D-3-phosphoglycerate dehydrogenase